MVLDLAEDLIWDLAYLEFYLPLFFSFIIGYFIFLKLPKVSFTVSTYVNVSGYFLINKYRKDENLNLYAVWKTDKKELTYTVEYYKDGVKQDVDTEITKIIVDSEQLNTITVDKSKINTQNKYTGYEFIKTEPSVIPDTVNSGTVIKVYYNLK